MFQTLEKVEGQMQGITTESESLLKKTNHIASDIETKTKTLDGLMDALSNVGTTVGHVNQSIQGVSESVAHASHERDEKVTKALRWGDAAIELYLKWKRKKVQ
ncbi:DUF948 domain-containing protein [Halobacillus litoralis]|uniref:DUF948 domain-containing protein n=1 Tax=Halobacillus litoralis TaxID=45668 RepID=UPI00273FAF9C|nr:DUF948 domain-containing protein [Halobacillus litoralis]WLR48636.1 DUF948 domain-containing protein [Halobacillus litoralis]